VETRHQRQVRAWYLRQAGEELAKITNEMRRARPVDALMYLGIAVRRQRTAYPSYGRDPGMSPALFGLE